MPGVATRQGEVGTIQRFARAALEFMHLPGSPLLAFCDMAKSAFALSGGADLCQTRSGRPSLTPNRDIGTYRLLVQLPVNGCAAHVHL